MAIKERNLEVGTVLVGTYKKQSYECRVEEDEGKQAFVLQDGRRFKSSSAAASAIMNGKAVNGWLFWSLAAETLEGPAPALRSSTGKNKLIRRLPNQKGIEAGKARYWCDGCMKSFIDEAASLPEKCPAGHGEQERN